MKSSSSSEIQAFIDLDSTRSLYVGTLSDEIVKELGAEHLGFSGYYLCQISEGKGEGDPGIQILGKLSNREAAMCLLERLDELKSLVHL